MEIAKAQEVVQGLKEAGINFAVGLPDSQFHEVYEITADIPLDKIYNFSLVQEINRELSQSR